MYVNHLRRENPGTEKQFPHITNPMDGQNELRSIKIINKSAIIDKSVFISFGVFAIWAFCNALLSLML